MEIVNENNVSITELKQNTSDNSESNKEPYVIRTELKPETADKTTTNSLIQEYIDKLCVPIIDSISKDRIDEFQFFYDKHYTNYYYTNVNKEGQSEDMCIRVHTNKLIVISLACGNDIIKSGKKVIQIDFVVNKTDRSNVKLHGKKKHGAKQLHPDTCLCKVRLEGEDEMRTVRAGMTGQLIEVNAMIKDNPDLLRTDPKCNGFLAILMPKGIAHSPNTALKIDGLMSENDYLVSLKNKDVN